MDTLIYNLQSALFAIVVLSALAVIGKSIADSFSKR